MSIVSIFIFPMRSKTLFCYLVHTVATNLHLNPLTLLRHQSDVESLIAISFRMVEPVAQTVWMALVYSAYCNINVETFVDFVGALFRSKDDAHGKNIINLIKRNMLVLHLIPNRIRTLNSCLDFILYAKRVEGSTNRSGEVFEELLALLFRHRKLICDILIFFRMLILEAKVFKFSLYLVESKTVGERSIYIHRFASNLVLLVRSLRSQSAHVVQTVANLNQYHSDIVAHSEQQLLEVFGLSRSLVSEYTTTNLGKSVYNHSYLRTEDILDVFYRVVGIFDNIMQECGTNTC